MNGLILFIGESFRLGNQGTRNIGSKESYSEQIKACESHIYFIKHIIQKFQLNSISVFISSYNTQFNNQLLSIYNNYLIGNIFYDNTIGLNNLFHKSLSKIEYTEKYDFILYIRIDLFLKEHFINVFNPFADIILFPTICWVLCNKHINHPRVNDTILFIPKKYYKYINNIIICHESWFELIHKTDLTYDDMGTMINTYHDSDSFKDYNPLYYIVNRKESNIFHSEGFVFNKYNFN